MNKFEELLVKKGLYGFVDISIDELDELEENFIENNYCGYKIDCFCVQCNEARTFEHVNEEEANNIKNIQADNKFQLNMRGLSLSRKDEFQKYLNKKYSFTFQCTRDNNHLIFFDLYFTENKAIKVGQYPSFADISFDDNFSKYKSILGNEQFVEYRKAIGLNSHGIGIGSFVYLRRIIEWLVFEEYKKVEDTLGIERKKFQEQKFEEKIETLKDYLPNLLVENRSVYGILSKGVHQLSEKECISMFEKIKIGIDLILDEALNQKERQEKEKTFRKFVGEKKGELKNSG